MFDQLFFSVFNYYKGRKNRNANTIAIVYITLLHSSIVLFLGVFFSEFLIQMRVDMPLTINPWILFTLAVVGLYFNNWLQYGGRKRTVKKARYSSSGMINRSIVALWLVPILCLFLSIIFLKLV